MSSAAQQILKSVFGYDRFRGQQEAVIETLVDGGDALVLMPTGGGKSLCYQIPALLKPGIAIVVSPLIALMQDQVAALRQTGVAARVLNSSLEFRQQQEVESELAQGRLDLLYIAPERLLQDRTLAALDQIQLALFAIDEAHCVSQWGHDFRPEYVRLSVLHERYPRVPRIALTATADEPTRNEIAERLNLQSARRFVSSFDRPNITYRVGERNKGNDQLLQFIRQRHAGSAGIVYCLSRRGVETTANWLNARDIRALPYHAGMSSEDRNRNQNAFINEEGVVVVATIAFGMGIDKPNVRFVAHLDLPPSLEAYYQETGRAGRDGLSSDAWMIFGLQDVVRRRQMLEESDAPEERKRVERIKLNAMLGYCEISSCRRRVLLRYFGDDLPADCGNCDNCLTPPETWDGTEAARMALSAVYRSGQRFGVGHVVDILRGRETERMMSFDHHRLSTFGIGKSLGENEWRSVFRQLIARGLLLIDVEGYGGLRLAPECREVLRGDRQLSLRRDRKRTANGKSERKTRQAVEFSDESQERLWEALREKRKALAQEQKVPPYVIFHDATLMQIVSLQPRSLSELATIPGVGEKKLERYGEIFLQLIDQHNEAPGDA